jgi:hypothetical protein
MQEEGLGFSFPVVPPLNTQNPDSEIKVICDDGLSREDDGIGRPDIEGRRSDI